MLEATATILSIYGGSKILGAVAAKFGIVPAAHFFAGIAPSIMSYTFFACTAYHLPKLATFCLLPQFGLSTLMFLSLGPNAFVLKNAILPSVFAWLGYQGWLSSFPLIFSGLDNSIRNCCTLIATIVVLAHVIYIARAFAVRLVYPAPIISELMPLKQLRDNALGSADIAVSRHRIASTATPGAFLDALFITNPPISTAASGGGHTLQQTTFPQAWLVYLGGNGEIAEAAIDAAKMYSRALGCKAAVYNPRGVGESGGIPVTTADELVADAVDVIRHIIEKFGAKQEEIVLFCHSIGGGVGTEVAVHHFPRVSIVIDRSFSNLPDAARAMMPIIPQPLVKFALPKFFGSFDNDENFDKIAHERKVVSFHLQDQIIKYEYASLARLGQFGKGGKDEHRVIELTGRSQDPHNSPTEVFPAGHTALIRRMAQFLREGMNEIKK